MSSLGNTKHPVSPPCTPPQPQDTGSHYTQKVKVSLGFFARHSLTQACHLHTFLRAAPAYKCQVWLVNLVPLHNDSHQCRRDAKRFRAQARVNNNKTQGILSLTFFVDDGNSSEHGGLGFGQSVAEEEGVEVHPRRPHPYPPSQDTHGFPVLSWYSGMTAGVWYRWTHTWHCTPHLNPLPSTAVFCSTMFPKQHHTSSHHPVPRGST